MKLELDNVRTILLDFEKILEYNKSFKIDKLSARSEYLNIPKNDYLYTLDKLFEGNLINCVTDNNSSISSVLNVT